MTNENRPPVLDAEWIDGLSAMTDAADAARIAQIEAAEMQIEANDEGRDNLTGGLGYVLVAAAFVCITLAVALVWRLL